MGGEFNHYHGHDQHYKILNRTRCKVKNMQYSYMYMFIKDEVLNIILFVFKLSEV